MKIAKLFLLVALCLLLPLPALAAGPTVSMTPAPLDVAVGQVVPLVVKIANVEGLYGFEMRLEFDPAVVQIEDADPNTPGVQVLPGDFLSLDMLVRNSADNTAGTVEYVLTQINPSEAQNGSGTLFTIFVKGRAAGESAFEITQVQFASRDGDPIDVTWTDSEAVVGAASGPAVANPTPLPTAPAPQIDLTAALQEQAETPAAPPTVRPTATPSAAATTVAPATETPARGSDPGAQTPTPTLMPAVVASPTGATLAAPVASDAANTTVTAPDPALTQLPAGDAASQPTAQPPAEKQTSESRDATSAAIVAGPAASNSPPAAASTRGENGKALLFAGGGLLLLAAGGAIGLVVLRRGR